MKNTDDRLIMEYVRKKISGKECIKPGLKNQESRKLLRRAVGFERIESCSR